MAEIEFRDYLPYHKSIAATPVAVSTPDTWTQLNVLTITDSLPAGEYVITTGFTWSSADVNDSVSFRVQSALTSGDVHTYEPKDANDLVSRSVLKPVTHAGGPVTFTFEGLKTSATDDMTVAWSALEFERKT